MKDVLPKEAEWLKDSVVSFDPENNKIKTKKGDTIQYEIMIVALGLQINWDIVEYILNNFHIIPCTYSLF